MPTSVTPVLSTSAGYLTDIRDQVMSLVRFTLMNPGGISSFWEDEIISFRNLAARYENNKEDMISYTSEKLTTILNSKFKDSHIVVNMRGEDIDAAKYRVIFDITMTHPITDSVLPLLVSGYFLVDPTTYDITLKWHKSDGTASQIF